MNWELPDVQARFRKGRGNRDQIANIHWKFLGGKICWRRDRLPTPLFLGFPGGSDGKESTCKKREKEFTCSVGDLASIPGLGRSPGGGHSYSLQYSFLENPHGQRSLVGHSPLGDKELDTTEWLSTTHGSLWGRNSIFWLKKKRSKWFQSSAAENVVCASSRKSW